MSLSDDLIDVSFVKGGVERKSSLRLQQVSTTECKDYLQRCIRVRSCPIKSYGRARARLRLNLDLDIMVVSTPDRVAYVAFEAEFRRTYWREDARDSTFFRKEVAGDFSDLTIEWQDYLVEAYIDLINYRAYTKDAETDLDKKQGTPLLPGGPRPPYVYSNFGWNDKSAIAEYADAYREYSDACEGYLESLGDFIRLANEIPDFTYQRGPLIIGLTAEQRTVRSKWDAAWPIVEELEVAQDVGTPMEQLASLSKARQAALLNHRWVGQWELGAGAFGRATGWVKQNKDGIVSDVSLFTARQRPSSAFH